MDFGAALMGLLIAFGIKLFVMIFAARLLFRLYRLSFVEAPRKLWLVIPEQERGRFRMLTWGLLFFCISEFTCGIEVYILTRSSLFFSWVHSITSTIAMACTAVGVFQLFDWKYFHMVDRSATCIAVKTCNVCTKRTSGECQYQFALLMTATLLLFMAAPVFFVSTAQIDADPRPYVLPFDSWNRWYDTQVIPWLNRNLSNVVTDGNAFFLPSGMLVLEFRILPLVSMLLAAFSIFSFLRKKEDEGIAALLLSFGSFAYVLFEAIIYGLTRDAIFGALVHESGEFLFLVMITNVLAKMFPQQVAQLSAIRKTPALEHA